jgi:hypothetical protein
MAADKIFRNLVINGEPLASYRKAIQYSIKYGHFDIQKNFPYWSEVPNILSTPSTAGAKSHFARKSKVGEMQVISRGGIAA